MAVEHILGQAVFLSLEKHPEARLDRVRGLGISSARESFVMNGEVPGEVKDTTGFYVRLLIYWRLVWKQMLVRKIPSVSYGEKCLLGQDVCTEGRNLGRIQS